ncbi:hypothetical protein KP509_14G072400 [Ceratopteris richardii]|uniref:Uncharacterized protein n=1 Tax=Ceratopteris richardii TaxID=49495 RepID=A0A8T2TG91_CERRI|nr:hypothetical protein KP509_14G072400 [Ceratopteris richardii]
MAREDCKECCSEPRVPEEKMLLKNVIVPIDQWLNSPQNTLMSTEGVPDRQGHSTMEQRPNHKQGFAISQESCESSAIDVELMSIGVNNVLSNQEKTVKLCLRADSLHDDEACQSTEEEYHRNSKRKKKHSRIRKIRRHKYWMFNHDVNSHDPCCWGILTHHWMGKRGDEFQRNTEKPLPFSADTASHESTTRSTSFPITDNKGQGRNLPNNTRNQERPLSADEQWPFLMRFPVSCFSICMGFGIQTVLWKTLSTIKWLPFMHIPKIYGQWLSEGRRLSESANPASHLSLVGNFVGALLAATTDRLQHLFCPKIFGPTSFCSFRHQAQLVLLGAQLVGDSIWFLDHASSSPSTYMCYWWSNSTSSEDSSSR